MNYLSCAEAAKAMGITVRRIQQMCKQGEIPGASKEGRTWRIPENAVYLIMVKRRSRCQLASQISGRRRLTTIMLIKLY